MSTELDPIPTEVPANTAAPAKTEAPNPETPNTGTPNPASPTDASAGTSPTPSSGGPPADPAPSSAPGQAAGQPGHAGLKKKNINGVVLVATMGALAFGFDTGVISGAIPFLKLPTADGGLALSPNMVGWVTSSLVLGAAFGGILSGGLADRNGRKKTLLVLAALFIIGALGTSLAPTAAVMVIFRFILGLAVGGASATVPVFIGELAPTHIRGTLVARNELTIVTGQLLAYTTNAVIANVFPGHPHAWRFMLVLCTLPALALFFGTFHLTESPRWLVSKGRRDDAEKVLWQLRHDDDVSEELNALEKHVQWTRREASTSFFDDLRVPWMRRITLIGIALAFLSQMTGVNSVMYYAPMILIDTGLGTNAALVATIGNGVVAVCSVAFGSIVLLPRFRRRPMLLIGQIGVTCALALMGAMFTVIAPGPTRAYLVLAFMMLFLFFMQGFVAVIFWLMLAEIFPLRIRGKAMGLAVFANWMANFLVASLFPPLEAALGGNLFFIFTAINFATIFFYLKFIPETKGRSLEQLEEDFAKHGRALPESP
ncbi:sugar porter family MFS transporter [Propionibacterium freudenreichii]|uniref:sugar porter family MFS transporter n=1 Tax=Propionibacterium freudenreichii TaxID=1744 RepID=UPI0005A5C5BA|nr:sugar porter family MFS transporter [Propionibacterium freudenreichii]MDK9661988.1 sugar porter family MFS transporter [Propionibacterium freudenreichii]CEI49882.1 iolT1 (Major myo-inositol transporter iolT1) [Propionibacterium freudenreichii]